MTAFGATARPGGRTVAVAVAVVLLAALILSGCAAARGSRAPAAVPTSSQPGPTTRLGPVGIIVRDLPRALRFYRLMGLAIPEGVDGDSYRLTTAGGQVLFWETPAEIHRFDPDWTAPEPASRQVVLEFAFASASAVDGAYRALIARGGGRGYLPPFDQSARIRYAIVEDPDGNQISLRYSDGP